MYQAILLYVPHDFNVHKLEFYLRGVFKHLVKLWQQIQIFLPKQLAFIMKIVSGYSSCPEYEYVYRGIKVTTFPRSLPPPTEWLSKFPESGWVINWTKLVLLYQPTLHHIEIKVSSHKHHYNSLKSHNEMGLLWGRNWMLKQYFVTWKSCNVNGTRNLESRYGNLVRRSNGPLWFSRCLSLGNFFRRKSSSTLMMNRSKWIRGGGDI